jgi:hypothetical protein
VFILFILQMTNIMEKLISYIKITKNHKEMLVMLFHVLIFVFIDINFEH